MDAEDADRTRKEQIDAAFDIYREALRQSPVRGRISNSTRLERQISGPGNGRSTLGMPAVVSRLSFERLLQIVERLFLRLAHSIDTEPDRLRIKRRGVDAKQPVDETLGGVVLMP